MKTRGIMMRKEMKYNIYDCNIEKIIILPEEQYRYFMTHMLSDYNFIAENKELMYTEQLYEDNYLDHCLLIMGEESEDGVLVESEGANYARYSAYQPHIKSYINETLRNVADEILHGKFGKQEEGSWLIGWDDIKEHFDITVSNTNGIGQMLVDELQRRDEVAEIIATEDCIEMSVILMQNENTDVMDLVSVMGCNITEQVEKDMEEETSSMTQNM